MKKHHNITIWLAVGAGVLLVSWAALGVVDFVQRAKQVRTYANLQIISKRIDNITREGEALSSSAIKAAISETNEGLDAWGSQFVFCLDVRSGEYLIISLGADHELDVEDPCAYLDFSERNIRGDYSRDIIFLSGRPLTKAGK